MVISITMLIAIGVSFATWDSSAVKATNGGLSQYANAKLGDTVFFGNYYQTNTKDANGEYVKTPIEWLVVDKDERSGQLTLMSKYILAAGSYFGNNYKNLTDDWGFHYQIDNVQTAENPYNQAYVESTLRAYLNNLERRDMGADSYSAADGYRTSVIPSVTTEKLYTSVGFSNSKYRFTDDYLRPINNEEYKNRPATRGFYDEAFSNDEKAIIIPKAIAGYTGHRWPNNNNRDPQKMSYIEGSVDKIWVPSAAELNNIESGDEYTNPSDASCSTVFEYFKGKTGVTLQNALKTTRTELAENSFAMNYSIPVYKYQSTEINIDINATTNSTDHYWTRSPMSYYYSNVRYVTRSGSFSNDGTNTSYFGVCPCVLLKY